MKFNEFVGFLNKVEKEIPKVIMDNHRRRRGFSPEVIDRCATSYIERGGKRLRPAVLLMACGAVGGDEAAALPAAAAVELFHTWTLVHDDLIDNDHLRRGQPTVHVLARTMGLENYGFSEKLAGKFGEDIAVLTGDVQHGWCISMLTEKTFTEKLKPDVVFTIINRLQSLVLCTLVHGEVRDVELGMTGESILDIPEDEIINMLWMKTGILYEFAGLAGAMIGKNLADADHPEIVALKNFCSNCGTAFQLRDDILGILGKEDKLGKPVGSDIREGKKTTIIRAALQNASESQARIIRSILGKHDATEDEIGTVTWLLVDLGGIQHTHDLSVAYVEKAVPYLDDIRASRYKTMLEQWAHYMIERNY
ncbi:polyprenyl synthetase family protein [bacterium]|nr:polyprenyl synthetase family protein [bacterium]